MNRRQFLKQTGLATGMAAQGFGAPNARDVAIILDPADPIASAAPVKWAAAELQQALSARGVRVHSDGSLRILVADAASSAARRVLEAAKVTAPAGPEVVALAPGLAAGSDVRGAVYAVLELADRVRHASDPLAALAVRSATVERPSNVIRSIARCFESDVEDKSWFYDRDMWRAYLSMLATHRYNRFSLTLGLGYNFPRSVRDVYFYFAYPFLVPVPGYNVRAAPLPDAERDRNLETLRFIGEETVKRGLQFQLAVWTHAYRWIDSPQANYTIEGLTPANHAPYCRDALTAVLKACPAISGVTFRVHGESGIPEGSYDFWKTVFDGIARCGRRVEIDMHAKGIDQKTIDVALATGMPVNVSPKYWAEHMGLSYHQAAIRELERSTREAERESPFTVSGGSRRFTRYGYADLLPENRRYGILHRIWPGTQRLLLWGDPAQAAGYGRASSFCGSVGVELCEPLSFKGRMGSGLPGGRCAYANASLNPKYDWDKYLYTYRLWGRLIYNPDADPEGWRRYLRKEFQSGAQAAELALANASRVLPLVTTAHGVSGSNNTYWPEVYTNMPIVDPERRHPYRDTPTPRRFGAVSPFDPQLFSRADDFAKELAEGKRSGKYSPLEVAQWLEDFAGAAAKNLKEAETRAGTRSNPEFRRLAADVAIQSGLGQFFAWKLRAAVLWALHERTGDSPALQEALKAYRAARAAWAEMANGAKGIYAADITYGMVPHMRGHWLDRLAAIDEDIADMEKRLQQARAGGTAPAGKEQQAVRAALERPRRPSASARHTPAARFRPGEPLAIELSLEKGNGRQVTLHYRHVNQAELWRADGMQWRDNRYRAVIAGDYTRSPYPLQYYFELHEESAAWLYPGFEATLSNQPYFVVRQA